LAMLNGHFKNEHMETLRKRGIAEEYVKKLETKRIVDLTLVQALGRKSTQDHVSGNRFRIFELTGTVVSNFSDQLLYEHTGLAPPTRSTSSTRGTVTVARGV
jgi:hypothetical protein